MHVRICSTGSTSSTSTDASTHASTHAGNDNCTACLYVPTGREVRQGSLRK